MPQSHSNLKAYKGPAILVAAAVTLIAAVAIPKNGEKEQPKVLPVDINSAWTAEVKRVETPVGKQIAVGETLLVLADPALEAEISKLEDELKIALLGTKEAVVDASSMMGMIGTLPRVVWQTVEEPAVTGPIAKAPHVVKSDSPQVVPLTKDVAEITAKVSKADLDVQSKDSELSEATSALNLADTDFETAQASQSAASMLLDRAQRLYDMGAIAKKKLDSAVEDKEQATQALAEAKAKVDTARERQSSLEKELSELKSELSKLQVHLSEAKSKLEKVKANPVIASQATPEQKPPVTTKRVKKVVYGTTDTQESYAPVSVDLVDSKGPGETQKIEALRAKLIELKMKREDLKIKAVQPGRVLWVAEAGSKVEPGAKLVSIQP